MFPIFKNVREKSTAKNYHPVSLLFVVSNVFEKLVNNKILDHLEKYGLFSDFQYGVCLLHQLYIFSQLYLIKLLGHLTGLGLLGRWHLMYPRLLTGFCILVYFTNFFLYYFFSFYHNKIHPVTNCKAIKNKINKTR